MPRPALSSEPPTTQVEAEDIELDRQGRLYGTLYDAAGGPVAGKPVVLRRDGVEVSRTKSDAQGRFTLSCPRGGTYFVAGEGDVRRYRIWTWGTAPPSAHRAVRLIRRPGTIARGQMPLSDALFSQPVIMAAVIAAAVAIPIAISNSSSAS